MSLSLADLKDLATIVAVIGGGFWAYFNFFQGRVYRPRLEVDVLGRVVLNEDAKYLLVSARLKNVGLSKIQLKKEGTALSVYSFHGCANPTFILEMEKLADAAVFSVFDHHEWIESGEPVEEQRLIALPASVNCFVQIELRVVVFRRLRRNIEWRVWSIAGIDNR